MNLDPRDVVIRMGEGMLDDTDDPCLQCLIVRDIVVGVNLNLHNGLTAHRVVATLHTTRRPVMA